MNILVVDDEPLICEILALNLEGEGYRVLCAHSGEDAMKMLDDCQLILLDVMMGGMSGFRFAEYMRQHQMKIPVIFLTAKDTENDMLTGFSVGADDYIAKPFSIKEVLARVKAVLKRYEVTKEEKPESTIRTFGNVILDLELKEVRADSTKIQLTKTEFEIISLLSSHPEHIYSRTEIIDLVWGDDRFITERTVDVHITRLRKKLGQYAGLISNRAGFGYHFNAQ
jgi:DNA-binding response OmpR family regulator